MKTTKLSFTLFAVLVAGSIAITSCRKKDNPDPQDTDASAANDNSLAEKTADDVNSMAGIAVDDSGATYYRLDNGEAPFSGCGTITYSSNTVTITFNGSQCLDGHTRSGSLSFINQSTGGQKFYRNPGFTCSVVSNGYVVDGNAVSISKTITNTTAANFNPATTNMTWTIVSNVSITKSNGTLTWNSTKYKTLLNTSDTVNVYHGQAVHISWDKARVGITGNASGKTASGESFTANVNHQMVRDFTCSPVTAHPNHHPFIDGDIDFTPGTKKTRNVNYAYPAGMGSGACDDQALLTIGTYTTVITP